MAHHRTASRRNRLRYKTGAFLFSLVAMLGAVIASGVQPSGAFGFNFWISDEFYGPAGTPANPAAWVPMHGGDGWGNNELQSYTTSTSNISLDGEGHLAITARRETFTGTDGITRHYTSGRIVNIRPFQYGYLAANIYLPEGKGLWPAFWTVGADIPEVGWPSSGEIDIMESRNDMTAVLGSLHGPDPKHMRAYKLSKYYPAPRGTLAGWHVYSINWKPGEITWFLDGMPYQTLTKDSLPDGATWEFDKPHVIELNLAVGGDWPGSPDETTPDTATMLVDWIRLFETQ